MAGARDATIGPVAMSLPPSIQADLLVLRRMGRLARARPLVGPALLVLGCVVLACGSFYPGLGWCIPVSAMLALAGGYAVMRSRLMAALVRARFGWCGALPLRAWAIPSTLLVLATAGLATAILVSSVLLVIASVPAWHPEALGFALIAIDGGLAVGTFAAAIAVFRKGGVARARHAEGIREPLFALPWLNDPRLPHLLDWQRRAALDRWRRGGSGLIAVVLVAVPDGASIPTVVGLLLRVLSLVWLDVVMGACARVTAEAVGLLGAMPVAIGRMRSASLRYPLVASIGALALAVVGAILMSDGVEGAAIWCGCAIAASASPFRRVIRATSFNGQP